jgi:hypothetical protein
LAKVASRLGIALSSVSLVALALLGVGRTLIDKSEPANRALLFINLFDQQHRLKGNHQVLRISEGLNDIVFRRIDYQFLLIRENQVLD